MAVRRFALEDQVFSVSPQVPHSKREEDLLGDVYLSDRGAIRICLKPSPKFKGVQILDEKADLHLVPKFLHKMAVL